MLSRQPRSVAVIGFGAMGTPMAGRLSSHGHAVVAVDPSPEARSRAAGLGIQGFADVAAAPRCDLVLVLVENGTQLLDCVASAIGARDVAGEVWVLCATVGPQAARAAAAVLEEAGARVLDAPVLGGVHGADSGSLRFLVGGDGGVLAEVADVLGVLGAVAPVGPQPGDGQATKIVNQLCSSIHLAAAAEAIALATRLGLDPSLTAAALRGGSGASQLFDDRSHRMAAPEDHPEVLTRLAILAKDNRLVAAEAEAHGAHVPLLQAAGRQYARAAELDLLEADDSRIIQTYLA
ncbi:MAG: NAD(P)-binding domain-containing protein [Nocardioides alkalitolerans]